MMVKVSKEGPESQTNIILQNKFEESVKSKWNGVTLVSKSFFLAPVCLCLPYHLILDIFFLHKKR